MRALIVDDEPVARRVLREELESLPAVEVVGEAENGQAALAAIDSLKPDLLFLDIEMPLMGGFELLDHLEDNPMPAVIMITAYDQHAIQAFEAGALDYLLKPINQARLTMAVDRAARTLATPGRSAENVARLQELTPRPLPAARKIVGKIGEEYFLLRPAYVLAFQADGDLVWIVTATRRYLATQNLRAIESRLAGPSFRRIHRNALVNIEHVRKLSALSSQRWLVTLDNGQEFVVSKRQARGVRDVVHW